VGIAAHRVQPAPAPQEEGAEGEEDGDEEIETPGKSPPGAGLEGYVGDNDP